MEQLVVEDLSYGLNDWRNIQTVVRETFKVFYDVMKSNSEAIKAQAAAIQRLEKALDNKVNKTEFQGSIGKSNSNRSGINSASAFSYQGEFIGNNKLEQKDN
jgi:hypothetical protein